MQFLGRSSGTRLAVVKTARFCLDTADLNWHCWVNQYLRPTTFKLIGNLTHRLSCTYLQCACGHATVPSASTDIHTHTTFACSFLFGSGDVDVESTTSWLHGVHGMHSVRLVVHAQFMCMGLSPQLPLPSPHPVIDGHMVLS